MRSRSGVCWKQGHCTNAGRTSLKKDPHWTAAVARFAKVFSQLKKGTPAAFGFLLAWNMCGEKIVGEKPAFALCLPAIRGLSWAGCGIGT